MSTTTHQHAPLLNLRCLRHGKYDGKDAPILSCKTCCKIYIDQIRAAQSHLNIEKSFNPYRWIEGKLGTAKSE